MPCWPASGWCSLMLALISSMITSISAAVLTRLPNVPLSAGAAGAGLGALPILGMYFIQTGAYTSHAVVACIPSAFLVHNLLLLNEFPDVEADKVADRKTIPITIGKNKAAIFYSVVAIAVYVW